MMSPQELFHWIVESIRRLFTTPIAGWTWGQWLLACILFSVVSSFCGGCLCCSARRRRRRRYYYRDNGEESDGYYSAPNNHPFLGGQSSIPMQQQSQQRNQPGVYRADPPALVPYRQV